METPPEAATYPYEWRDGQVMPFESLVAQREQYRTAGKRVVTTNGCFDLLHPGHVAFLAEAHRQGDILIVGLNSDQSVQGLKGPGRPVLPEQDRASLMAALKPVDHVLVFAESTPAAWLTQIRPDIHCKAADYTADSLPEAAAVRQVGGEVRILTFTAGHSTTNIVQRIAALTELDGGGAWPGAAVTRQLLDGAAVLKQTAHRASDTVAAAGTVLVDALRAGRTILLCGNGGSAADAQHFATELVVRYRRERMALPAIALTTDTSVLTAAGNDYAFDQIFARQVAALGRPGDVLVAISTSGTSASVVQAAAVARQRGLAVVALTGARPSPLSALAGVTIQVPSTDTPLVQQAHIAVIHALCWMVDEAFAPDN